VSYPARCRVLLYLSSEPCLLRYRRNLTSDQLYILVIALEFEKCHSNPVMIEDAEG
jgi:hypothetical protein